MKIEFYPVSDVTPDMLETNRRLSLSRNLPLHTERPAKKTKLAVVGSGPSTLACLDELRAFDGDVWGINGAACWLINHGIDATLFSACQLTGWSDVNLSGIRRAIISWSAPPEIFDRLAGCEILLAKIGEPGRPGGSSSVTAVPVPAIEMGYRSVTIYGCESSFSGELSHTDRAEKQPNALIVKCNGEVFETNPQMLMQSLELGGLIRGCPGFLFEKSGGLLRARMADADYDVIALSEDLHKSLTKAA